MLQCEADKCRQRERTIGDIEDERDKTKRELEDQMSIKCIDNDNLKRALEEQQYENETLRRTLHSKQDEIGSLHGQLEQMGNSGDEMQNKIEELEGMVKDVEEKNKRLVELLNANIYNKAE